MRTNKPNLNMATNEHQLTTTSHARDIFGEESLIYPVSSRRLGGLSIGINTAPEVRFYKYGWSNARY